MTRARVFVGGCERSGTTLMASLLADAAGLLFVPESPFFIRALRAHDRNIPTLGTMLSGWRVKTWGHGFTERVGELDGGRPPPELFDDMARLYAEVNHQTDQYLRGWVDNTPASIRSVAAIQRHVPDALHVHVIRDPRAVSASLLKVDFGGATPTGAAEQWKSFVLDGVLAEAMYPGRVVRVYFEELVADPSGVTRDVAKGLGLAVDDSWQPRGRSVDPFVARHEALIADEPMRGRSDAWRTELSARQIAAVEAVADNALELLGYEPYAVQALAPRWVPYRDRLVEGPFRLFDLLRRTIGRVRAGSRRINR